MTITRRLRSLTSRLTSSKHPEAPVIWSGTYSSFDEMEVAGEGFSSADAAAAAEKLLRETEAEPMPDEAIIDHQLLALAVRLIDRNPVHIVDVGGGVGQSYAAIRRMIRPNVTLRYCVVDMPPIIEHGRTLWPDSEEVTFAEDLDSVPFAPDVVFAKGAIQYWSDYADALRRLFATGAAWVLLEKVSLLMQQEYATEQCNVYQSRIPYWFMNRQRLLAVADQCGYALAVHRRLEREYDQSNFPPELRMGRAASLLFEKRNP